MAKDGAWPVSVECISIMQGSVGLISSPALSYMVVQAWNLPSWKVKAGGSVVQGHSQLYSDFEASLWYIIIYLKKRERGWGSKDREIKEKRERKRERKEWVKHVYSCRCMESWAQVHMHVRARHWYLVSSFISFLLCFETEFLTVFGARWYDYNWLVNEIQESTCLLLALHWYYRCLSLHLPFIFKLET